MLRCAVLKRNLNYASVNPFSEALVKNFRTHSPEEQSQVLESCWKTFRSPQYQDVEHRRTGLLKLASLLEEKASNLGALMTEEMGKPVLAGEAEARKCATVLRYYAENPQDTQKIIKSELKASYVSYEPIGVVLAVMPWNFPFWQLFRCYAPLAMLGNTVLLKHAPNVPQCAEAIEAIVTEAGLGGSLRNVFASNEDVDSLVRDPRIQGVTLTGSVRAGRAIGAAAGRAIKKSVLELGGSDPFIVLSDCDLDKAVSVAITSRFQNNGQTCIAAKRFIVEKDIMPKFRDAFVAAVQKLVVGDPMDKRTNIGPMARKDLRDELHTQVRNAINRGAKAIVQGGPSGPGFFYEPTVLSGVRPGMTAFDEELFGPCASLVEAKDVTDAVALANSSCFGLGATIFTNDYDRARQLAHQLTSGCVFVNSMVRSDPRFPFGGVKESGYGRELSTQGFLEFANAKTVIVE